MLVVDKNTFKTEVLENEGYVLVDFFGDGCEPCAALMPKVEALGEKYGDTAIIHIERCDISFKGIYSFLNRTFLEMYFSDTLYVNRQEDCGNLGLRKSKESYHPISYIKKCFIKITD